MPVKVNFPKAGMGIEEGTVSRWLKSVGDRVEKGEPLVEIETAKVLQEVVAPASGILVEIYAPEGSTPSVNTPLALINDEGG
jgi:pyruvate dehydrogenase E2 component (dihydrolipoamide acetyltransferase)